MKFKTTKTLLTTTLFMVTSLFLVSCGDDDVNCEKTYAEIYNAFDDFDTASENGDCEDLQGYLDKALNAMRKGKNCENIKAAIREGEYSNIEELINDMREDYEFEIADCGMPS